MSEHPAPAGSRRPVRVALVVDAREFGGAEAYAATLLRHLPDAFTPTLVATEPVPERLLRAAAQAGRPVLTARPIRNKADVGGLAAMWRALRGAEPDLVHLNLTTPANNRHAVAEALALRRPVVVTAHLHLPMSSRVQRSLLRAAYRRVDRVIAVSEEIGVALRSDLALRPGVLRVVGNGVEPWEPVPRRDEDGPVRIGGLGRVTEQKGFDLLIEAARDLVSSGRRIEVAVAGDGPERERLERLASGLPVRFEGAVEDPRGFLARLDVFCLPSRWEGLPFALLEAMMSGLPCVAAAVGDVPEALGGTGIVVPPGDARALASALGELADSPDERRRLGDAARARALARYSLDRMIRDTVDVYDEALARRTLGSGSRR